MPEIGIVIVTYNSADEIGGCLDALRGVDADVVVVDNASSDGTCDEVRQRGACLIRNTYNAGFAAAANQGFAALSTPFVLLLNPDAHVTRGLDAMRAACSQPGVAMTGGKLVGADGRPQRGFMVRRFPTPASLVMEALLLNRLLPRNPVNRRYRCLDVDFERPQEVEQPAGAFLMVRHSVWCELGGFDESFHPLWFEDVDFCKRATNCGYHAYYTPQAVAKHTGGHSIPQIAVEMKALYWYRSFLRYTVRHFRPLAVKVVSLAVIIGSILRMMADTITNRSLTPIRTYSKVLQIAGRVFMFGRYEQAGRPVARA